MDWHIERDVENPVSAIVARRGSTGRFTIPSFLRSARRHQPSQDGAQPAARPTEGRACRMSGARQRVPINLGAIAGAPADVKSSTFSAEQVQAVDSALLAQTHAIPSSIVFTAFQLSFSLLPFLSFLALSRVADRPLFSCTTIGCPVQAPSASCGKVCKLSYRGHSVNLLLCTPYTVRQ